MYLLLLPAVRRPAIWLLCVLSVCVGVTAAISAQGSLQAMVSPIPVWPADGKIPENLKSNYVFLGSKLGEIVVSYPLSLEDPTQTERRTFTFELGNQVSPTLSVRLAQDSDGLFVYDYTLQNGPSARQPIWLWYLVGPADDPGFRVAGSGWTAGRSSAVKSRQVALPTISQSGRAVVFYSLPNGEVIRPGDGRSGFRAISSYSPGFTTAFVEGQVGVPCCPSEVPTVVGDQIAVLQQPQWDGKVFVALGPRFPPGWSQQFIAADFHTGISQLVVNGTLKADSPFVKAALDMLANSMHASGVPKVADIANSLPAPGAGLESEIAAAMKLGGR